MNSPHASSPHPIRTVFLVAMDEEIEGIFDLDDWEQTHTAPFAVYRHRTQPAAIARTGIGKANAAAATQCMLGWFMPEHIINLGLVGSLNLDLPIGEARSITETRFFDTDVTAFGYEPGQIPGAPTTYQLQSDVALTGAKVISGDQFITDPSPLQPVLDLFPADFIDMELAAIAHVLAANDQLSLLSSYKAASDYCNASSAQEFNANLDRALLSLKQLAQSRI